MISRGLAALLVGLALPGVVQRAPASRPGEAWQGPERARVLAAAAPLLHEAPRTITAAPSPRSGGRHDLHSAGDYGWPDPASPDGPYIQRDGLTNPDNSVEHRGALIRLSVPLPALVATRAVPGETHDAAHAARHLRAWFVDEATRMNPSLLYAQAIQGRVTGRVIGTKPYGYMLSHLDALATLGVLLSTPQDDLWRFELPDGRGLGAAIAYMAPFIEDKTRCTTTNGRCGIRACCLRGGRWASPVVSRSRRRLGPRRRARRADGRSGRARLALERQGPAALIVHET